MPGGETVAKQADLFPTTSAPYALPEAARQRIGDEIERLIALLDAADGDADLEDNGDLEPNLGYSTGRGLAGEEFEGEGYGP